MGILRTWGSVAEECCVAPCCHSDLIRSIPSFSICQGLAVLLWLLCFRLWDKKRICGGWWISVPSCHFQKCHRLFCLFSTGQNSVSWSHFAAEALFFKKKKRKIMDFCLSHHLSSSSYPRNTQNPSPRESIQSHIYVIYQSPRSPGNIIYCPLFSLPWSILPCVFNSLFMSLVWILSCLIFAACFLQKQA